MNIGKEREAFEAVWLVPHELGFFEFRRFKSQVQHICSQLKKLGVFIESLDFFNSQLESTQ